MIVNYHNDGDDSWKISLDLSIRRWYDIKLDDILGTKGEKGFVFCSQECLMFQATAGRRLFFPTTVYILYISMYIMIIFDDLEITNGSHEYDNHHTQEQLGVADGHR